MSVLCRWEGKDRRRSKGEGEVRAGDLLRRTQKNAVLFMSGRSLWVASFEKKQGPRLLIYRGHAQQLRLDLH